MKKRNVEKTASRGIAIAPVFLYREADLTPEPYSVPEGGQAAETAKFEEVRESVKEELAVLSEKNPIFAAHLAIVDDHMLRKAVLERVEAMHMNVEQAIAGAVDEIAEIFQRMDDEYMRERSADVRDIGKRMLIKCKNITVQDLGEIRGPVILVARDLYPSDTVKINPSAVKGIITEEGGVTGHVTIIAKSYGIPVLTGVSGILGEINSDSVICMDAGEGSIFIDPEPEIIEAYEKRREQDERECERIKRYRALKPVTSDGKQISLCINVGSTDEIRMALDKNIDGVGLFRTEFLYMNHSHFPTEEEQLSVYREAVRLCPNGVTIRTLDIGGDKELSYYTFEPEANPFLGWRAIRISLDMPEMFATQLRAILRASAFGHIRMMLPMLISVEELLEAKQLLEKCKDSLRGEKIAFDERLQVGIMMETPASVLLADEFAKEADFFSIGTNDLTQYLLAVDRGNRKVASRYDPFHPAVIKAIQTIIDAGHRRNIKVGMCGEMAGNEKAVRMLLEMGLDEFSMAAGSIDYVRSILLQITS